MNIHLNRTLSNVVRMYNSCTVILIIKLQFLEFEKFIIN